jgi:hypothetical protein
LKTGTLTRRRPRIDLRSRPRRIEGAWQGSSPSLPRFPPHSLFHIPSLKQNPLSPDQEPLAQRRRHLGLRALPLRAYRIQVLHRHLWCLACPWVPYAARVGQGAGFAA